MPSPSSTATRTDCCSPISRITSRSRMRMPAARNAASSTARTPDPRCWRMRGWAARSASEMRECSASGCAGGQMTTSSSRTNGSNTSPRCGRAAPTTPSSMSSSSTRSHTVWVSCTTSDTSTSGFSRLKPPSRCGSSSSPGPVDDPSTSGPDRWSDRPATSRRSSSSSASIRRAWASTTRPASVRVTRRPLRSSRRCPMRSSSERIWNDTAGCEMPRSSAACENDPLSTTVRRVSSCLRSISESYPSPRTRHGQSAYARVMW